MRRGTLSKEKHQALLESAQTNRPVSVPQAKINRRPDATQEVSKKRIVTPLVRAASPGAQ